MKKIVLKGLLIAILILSTAVCCWLFFQNQQKKGTQGIFSAQVEGIRQTVKLSSLEVYSEQIFKDTIARKAVVCKVNARIYIHFDLENLRMVEQGDTLFVELPPEMIDVYESKDGYEVLDVWSLLFPEEIIDPPLSAEEENRIKSQFKQRFKDQMYEQGHVRTARQQALRSLAGLFAKFREQVVVIDHHPNGWRDKHLDPIAPPESIAPIPRRD